MDEADLARRLGKRLQSLRKACGLTQEAASERAGLAANYISEVERGAKVPSLGTLATMAEIYSVSLSEACLGVDRALPKKFARLETALAALSKKQQQRVLEIVRAALLLAETPEQ